MILFGRNINTRLSPGLKLVIIPLSILVFAVLLTIFSFVRGFPLVKNQMRAFDSAQRNENILSQKVEILRELTETLESGSDDAIFAVPSQNPVIWYLTVIKNVSTQHSIFIDRIGMEFAGNDAGTGKVKFELTVNGENNDVLNFVTSLKDYTPLTGAEKVTLEDEGFDSEKMVTIYTRWKDLPEKIPAVTDPIKGLTSQEEELLRKVVNLNDPSYSELEPTDENVGKDNPFEI